VVYVDYLKSVLEPADSSVFLWLEGVMESPVSMTAVWKKSYMDLQQTFKDDHSVLLYF
jgi:hypothetical protein